jgi:hypothetical protein
MPLIYDNDNIGNRLAEGLNRILLLVDEEGAVISQSYTRMRNW